jgi:hypothetical protein
MNELGDQLRLAIHHRHALQRSLSVMTRPREISEFKKKIIVRPTLMSEMALASGLMWPSTFLHVDPTN